MTRSGLEQLLESLELRGLNVVVHASLSGLGLPESDATFLCQALVDRLGPHGTIVMPAFTANQTVLGPERPAIAFHPELPTSADLGPVPEAFRRLPNTLRSNHPSHSFAALGPQARSVLSTQRDSNPLGPIKKLNVMRGDVVLLGTSLRSATAIHLAEEMAPHAYLGRATALRINAAGYEERVVVEHLPGCSRAFDRLEPRLDPAEVVMAAMAGGLARRIAVRYLVRLASTTLAEDPAIFICDAAGCESCAHKRAALSGTGRAARA